MASPFSSPHTWIYNVFISFNEPGVLETPLSNLHRQLNDLEHFLHRGYEDDDGHNPYQKAHTSRHAISESRISIVVFSKNYASSSWFLDELLEILKCGEEIGQIVMTIFYGVDPSDVRKQTGDFGKVFNETCAGKTEEERQRWSHALNDAVNIAGEHYLNWDNEADLIEKITRDVSNKLSDLGDIVGMKAHLQNMDYLLHSKNDEAMIFGICGPAGIGKTTIATALYRRLSSRCRDACFVENVSHSYFRCLSKSARKHLLEEQFFRAQGWKCQKKVLVILDDVDDLKQLEELANETTWFGPGSRIVVTTKNQEILQQHGIDNIYHVEVPSDEEALKIFCRNAFRQSNPHNGFEKLAKRVTELCRKLPRSLCVVGSFLHGKKEKEWEVMRILKTNHDHRDIGQVLRDGYESWPSKPIRKIVGYEPASSKKRTRIGKSKSGCSTGMAFLVIINLLLELASAVADQLSSIHKPYFARISLLLSVLSVVISILDLSYKTRARKARFLCKWPIPWFYYYGDNTIFGSFTDTVLLFCVVGQLIVSTINCSFIERRRDGPIKVSLWPLFFAIGMVISKFMENPANSKEILPITKTQ